MKNKLLQKLAILTTVVLTTISFTSCSSDDSSDGGFDGENKIVLKAVNNLIMQDNSTDQLEVEVLLITSLSETLDLEFALENNTVNDKIIAEIVNPKITLAPGQKKAVLTIASKTNRVLTEAAKIQINLIKNSSSLKLEKPLEITITPLNTVENLTPEQIELLEGYKKQGLDLYPLMGEREVTGEINFPGNEYFLPLNQSKLIPITGKTVITLSDKATAKKPVLKMISNPMGVEAYLYSLFRAITIDDEEIWTTQPASQAIMELINLTPDSKETFLVTLDGIEIDIKTKKVNFLGKGTDMYEDEFTIVPFEFKYSAWDRLKALVDSGDSYATENYEMGGWMINPSYSINHADITEDEFLNDTWKETKATLTDNSLIFDFVIDYEYNAGGYVQFKAEYKLK